MIEHLLGQEAGLDAHYLGYFECFNNGQFYEARDVLEELWLPQRGQLNHAFYQGLIQLAGAFVHLQKHTEARPRLQPAAALFKLARRNLEKYPVIHERLSMEEMKQLIDEWLAALENGRFQINPLSTRMPPRLTLLRISAS